MKGYKELSEKEKNNLRDFLVMTFEFSEEELAAIDKQKPMTLELFASCLSKCVEYRLDKLFVELSNEYPKLSDEYIKAIEEEVQNVILPERTPEEEEASWNRLCEKIREMYGDGSICK